MNTFISSFRETILPVEATRSQHPSSAIVKKATLDCKSDTGNSLDL